VTVARPEATELTITLAANGNVAAWQEAIVGSESNGLKLAEVRVNVGDGVKKGQVLAVFSPETVQADIAQSRASLAEARATAADAAGNAARARTLQATGALSQQQINQYQTTEQTAKARVEAAEAVLAAQQVRGRNTQVLAPDDGVISARTATVGSVVSAGTELFRLIRQGRLEWRAEVTSAELSRIAVGTQVFVVSASGAQVRGKVRSIAPTVDPQTRAALVYVDLPNVLQNTGIKAGMFARGDFELGRSSAPTVPQSSIVPRDGFNNVFVLQPDNRVSQLKVQIGRRLNDRIEITSALPEGAQIVVQGAGFLNDGDLVRVVATPAPATAAAQPATTAASAAVAK
jgi:RND family efflux transporter MFP subunit